MSRRRLILSTILLGTALLTVGAYARTAIQNKGSDTLVNVAQAWAEAYASKAPEIAIAVSGGGSGTGIAAMINGTVDIANASRRMKKKEIDLALERGQEPIEHIVGYDALAVFLHPNNPVSALILPQLSRDRRAKVDTLALVTARGEATVKLVKVRDAFKPVGLQSCDIVSTLGAGCTQESVRDRRNLGPFSFMASTQGENDRRPASSLTVSPSASK